MDRVWTVNKFWLLHEFYTIVGFEWFKTRLRVRIDALLRGFTWFTRCLGRSLHDSCAIYARYCADYMRSFRRVQPRICPVWGPSVPMCWSAWFINAWSMHLRGSWAVWPGLKGPVIQAQTQGLRTIREQIPTLTCFDVFRSSFVRGSALYAIAGFERFKTLLCVQIDVVLRDQRVSNVIDAILTRFVRDSCAKCQWSFAEISDNRVR